MIVVSLFVLRIYTQHTLNFSMPNNIMDVKNVCTHENLNIILDHS
jgi:hypothetical protein